MKTVPISGIRCGPAGAFRYVGGNGMPALPGKQKESRNISVICSNIRYCITFGDHRYNGLQTFTDGKHPFLQLQTPKQSYVPASVFLLAAGRAYLNNYTHYAWGTQVN